MNKMPQKNKPLVSIIMGSQSDYRTMKYAEKVFKSLKIVNVNQYLKSVNFVSE